MDIKLLIFGMIGVVGLIILLIGIRILKWFNKYTKKCTKRVMAKISGGETFSMGMTSEVDNMTYFYYNFSVDGKEYNVKSKYAISPNKYKIGSEVELLYNPENPEEVYNDKDGAKYAIFVPIILGSVALLTSILIFIVFLLSIVY